MNERLLEIDSRLAEIKKSLEAKDGNIEELVREAEELRNEKNGFAVAEEERKQALEKIAEETTVVEERKEEKTMNFTIDSPEYRVAFLKNLMGKELTAEERSVDLSGALPTSTANKVVSIIEKSPLLSKVEISRIAGNLAIPTESASDAASWGSTGAASNDTVGTTQLYATS